MSLRARLRSFFPIPTASVPFRPPTEGGTTIRSGFRQRQPVLISWFLLSCVAGALLDARKSSLASFDDADRKIRLLQELIQDEKDGLPGSPDETRKRLRAVGLGRREDRELWEKERAEKEKTEQERRSKMGFWQRHFGREGAEPAADPEFEAKMVAPAALTNLFGAPLPSATQDPLDVSFSDTPVPRSEPPTSPAQEARRIEFVPAEKRADWAKSSFM